MYSNFNWGEGPIPMAILTVSYVFFSINSRIKTHTDLSHFNVLDICYQHVIGRGRGGVDNHLSRQKDAILTKAKNIRTAAVCAILKVYLHGSLVLRRLEGSDPNPTNPNPKLTLTLTLILNSNPNPNPITLNLNSLTPSSHRNTVY